jgi:hypothetical protein
VELRGDTAGVLAVAGESLNPGVNTLTGEGLREVLDGADVVVVVSNSPSFEDAAVLEFFETSTGNLLAAEAAEADETAAGVGHHVALSVVGTERMADHGYFRARAIPLSRSSSPRRSPSSRTSVRSGPGTPSIGGC